MTKTLVADSRRPRKPRKRSYPRTRLDENFDAMLRRAGGGRGRPRDRP